MEECIMSTKKWKSVGYLSAKRETGTVVIMINEGEMKKYYIVTLADALDVLTGRQQFVKIMHR